MVYSVYFIISIYHWGEQRTYFRYEWSEWEYHIFMLSVMKKLWIIYMCCLPIPQDKWKTIRILLACMGIFRPPLKHTSQHTKRNSFLYFSDCEGRINILWLHFKVTWIFILSFLYSFWAFELYRLILKNHRVISALCLPVAISWLGKSVHLF